MLEAIDLSVGIFARGLTNLRGMLAKAEAHASSHAIEPSSLLTAQLADGMYDLAVQVHWSCEGAKLAVHRLLDTTATPAAADAKSFDELYQRIDSALAFLGAVEPAALEAGLARTIEMSHRGGSKAFRGDRFLAEFALPSFFFHLTTAYGILRHQGVPLQKGDFLGG
ncbi:MAG TPA: DUF1993 domain-containing protein [Polyangiaceae bacterium]|jgi:hypothetical protein|nr:DUF1993 domain-containing protein [Polyangiaceae bacterium]